MKPSTVRAMVIGLGGLLTVGLFLTLMKGDTQGARDVALAIVGMLVIGGLAGGAWWIRTQPRRSAADDAARTLGLRFSARDTFGLIDLPFPLLHRVATVRGLENVMVGTWHGLDVKLFDYWYARSSNPSMNDFERFSCVVTPLPAWWPDLLIAPETFATRALDHLDMGEVNLESDAFNRAFMIRSVDPRFASALLDARMMQWLLDRPSDTGFEVADGMLLCACPQLKPWALQPLLETAAAFLDHVPAVVSGLYPAHEE